MLCICDVPCRTDIYAEVDVRLGGVNGTKGVFLAARVDKGGCDAFSSTGIFLYVFPQTKSYILANDLGEFLLMISLFSVRIMSFVCP